MNEKETVSELREEKKAELKALIRTMGKLEKAKVATKHGDMEMHLGIVKDLDKLYRRRRSLIDFLRELNGDHRLILSAKEVMHFDSGGQDEKKGLS